MTSGQLGLVSSAAEVVDIGPAGVWLLVDGEEFFMPYEAFPWFRNATVAAVFHVERSGVEHLHWPELDVDLHLNSLRDPAAYPLVAKAGA